MKTTSTRGARLRVIGTAACSLMIVLAAWPLWVAHADRVSTLEQLEPGMTRAEVVALVGEPDHESDFAAPRPLTLAHWTFHTTPFSGHQLGIGFEDGRAAKVVFCNSLVENVLEELLADGAAPQEPSRATPSQEPPPPAPPEPPPTRFDSAYLFGRLHELGADIVAPEPAAMQLFDMIPIDGTEEEVTALLGAPAGPDDKQPDATIWRWEGGTVRVRYRGGVAREKEWIGLGWRVRVVGDVWTAESKHLAIRASGGEGA
jgi:hypothetical protein